MNERHNKDTGIVGIVVRQSAARRFLPAGAAQQTFIVDAATRLLARRAGCVDDWFAVLGVAQ